MDPESSRIQSCGLRTGRPGRGSPGLSVYRTGTAGTDDPGRQPCRVFSRLLRGANERERGGLRIRSRLEPHPAESIAEGEGFRRPGGHRKNHPGAGRIESVRVPGLFAGVQLRRSSRHRCNAQENPDRFCARCVPHRGHRQKFPAES